MESFARELDNRMVAFIPKDPLVQECERRGVTVIEGKPDSEIADIYRKLAEAFMGEAEPKIPQPISDERLRELSRA